MKAHVVWLAAALAVSAVAGAAESTRSVQAIVTAGLQAYKAHDAESAMLAWTTGGPLEMSEAHRAQTRYLRQTEAAFGQLLSYQVVQTVLVSDTYQISYVQLDYEKGPLFMKCTVFKGRDGWRMLTLKFDADIEHIWPMDLWTGA